ncbi:MAG: hypothetical protein Q9198_001816 [Flavoplaca austrocitrina]
MLSCSPPILVLFSIAIVVNSIPTEALLNQDLSPISSQSITSQDLVPATQHEHSILRRQFDDLWHLEAPYELAIVTTFSIYIFLLMLSKLHDWNKYMIAQSKALEPNSTYRIGAFTYCWICDFSPVPRDLVIQYVMKKRLEAEKGVIPLTATDVWTREDGKVCWIKQTLEKKYSRKVELGRLGVRQLDYPGKES